MNGLLQPIIMPQLMLLLYIAMPTFIILMINALLWRKAPKQARTLLKAALLKRNTIVVADEDGTLDVRAPKMTATGHLEVSKSEIYNPLKSGNPIITNKTFWKGSGIPVHMGAGRKAAYTSPESLKAISIAEATKDKLPEEWKQYAEEHNLEIVAKKNKKGEVTKTKTIDLLSLTPLKLKQYFDNAIDVDAEDVLYDKAFQEGVKAAGKPPRWIMGIAVLALCLAPIFLILVMGVM